MRRRDFIAGLGAAAWPLVARAQQPAKPVIGFLSSGAPGEFAPSAASFMQVLREAGFNEGQNLVVEQRWANYQYDQLPEMAAELVRARVSLIVAFGNNLPAQAAKASTSTIPIVFLMGADPVALGLVDSLNRPGGNITGVTITIVDTYKSAFNCSTTWFQSPDVLGTSAIQTIRPIAQPLSMRRSPYARGAEPLKSRMPGPRAI